MLEVAAWAEGIPFLETRDYVKKVLANAAIYQALLSPPVPAPAPIASASGPAPAPTAPTAAGIDLGPRLQPLIGPRPADAPPENRELP
jgi:soluble lytic murein transglycosylase